MGYGGGMVPESAGCEAADSELCKGGFLGYPRYELGYRPPHHAYVNHHAYQHEAASPPPGESGYRHWVWGPGLKPKVVGLGTRVEETRDLGNRI